MQARRDPNTLTHASAFPIPAQRLASPQVQDQKPLLPHFPPCCLPTRLTLHKRFTPASNYLLVTVTLYATVGNANAPMVLVGNKSDLARQVSLETVLQTKAELLDNCPYIETSAKFNLNVIKLFIELLQVSDLSPVSRECDTRVHGGREAGEPDRGRNCDPGAEASEAESTAQLVQLPAEHQSDPQEVQHEHEQDPAAEE